MAAVVEVVLLFATGLLATIDESSTGDWVCWFEGGRVDPFGSNQTKTFELNFKIKRGPLSFWKDLRIFIKYFLMSIKSSHREKSNGIHIICILDLSKDIN